MQLLDEDANSIAIVMKHMAGQHEIALDRLSFSDGEKSWRNRDSEVAATRADAS